MMIQLNNNNNNDKNRSNERKESKQQHPSAVRCRSTRSTAITRTMCSPCSLLRITLIVAIVAVSPLSTNGFAPVLSPSSSSLSKLSSPFATQQLQQPNPFSSSSKTVSASPSRRTSSSLDMAPVGIAALAGAITGGFFAGGLHAVAGPDHLAALLPRCVGQRWFKAGRVGALWGLGHGISATLLGVVAFWLKNRLSNTSSSLTPILKGASHLTEIAVGLSLIVIGVLGMREAREWQDDHENNNAEKSLSAAAVDNVHPPTKGKRAVIFNGLLHGFSWDGAPSLAPALAVATWAGNLSFLISYALGTMTTMAITTTLIGEGTRKAGDFFNRPDFPQKLSYFSSILAIAIGVVWCGLAFV